MHRPLPASLSEAKAVVKIAAKAAWKEYHSPHLPIEPVTLAIAEAREAWLTESSLDSRPSSAPNLYPRPLSDSRLAPRLRLP